MLIKLNNKYYTNFKTQIKWIHFAKKGPRNLTKTFIYISFVFQYRLNIHKEQINIGQILYTFISCLILAMLV